MSNRRRHVLYGLIGICYFAILIYFLFFAEGFRERVGTNYHYNFIPFYEITRYLKYYRKIGLPMVILNLLGNVVAFIPFGYLLPLASRGRLRFWSVALFTLEFSVLVEVLQLFTRVGSCDVDDVILNTLGGVFGYGCYRLWKMSQDEKAQQDREDGA